LYVSFDAGLHWQSLQLNLPDTSIQGVQVAENDLVIGTHGRGFYVLPDIDILRQATATLTSEELHLFEPRSILRGRDKELSVDYYLAKDADLVTIEFLDAQGQVVRSLQADAKNPPKPATPEEELMAMFFGASPKVSTKAGLNRLTWDLRYEGATVFPGMIMWAAMPQRGPLAPPGAYSVKVTAGSLSKTSQFKIGVDPRLTGVTEADLVTQFKLSAQIRDAVSQANLAVIQVRALRAQLNERMDKVPPRRKAEIQRLVDGLMKPLTAVEEEMYQVKNHSFEDPLNFPIKLNNKIAALAGVIESADVKPTDSSQTVFAELSKRLETEVQRMKSALTTELPRVNSALAREKLAPVDPSAKPAAPKP
jgi:hypothetical protein